MELKEILGEELANQLTSSTDATVKLAVEKIKSAKLLVGDETSWIPKKDFNEKLELVKQLKADVSTRDEQLKTLKDASVGNEALQKQIDGLQKANKEAKDKADAEMLKARKSAALQVALLDSGVVDATARGVLSKNFDLDKLELDEQGKPKGFDEQLKPLRENVALKGMFGAPRMVGQEHVAGSLPEGLLTRDQVKAMTQEQVNANIELIDKSMAQWK